MYIRQISIFLANKSGTLAEVTDFLYQHNVNLRSLSIADTADFGILRVIVDRPEETLALLKEAHYTTLLPPPRRAPPSFCCAWRTTPRPSAC